MPRKQKQKRIHEPRRIGAAVVRTLEDATSLLKYRNRKYVAEMFDKDDPATWPRIVDEAVAVLKLKLSKKTLDQLAAASEGRLGKYHWNVGLWIRNAFGLWRTNTELILDTGTLTPDEASAAIIKALWKSLQKGRPKQEEPEVRFTGSYEEPF